MIDGGGYKNSRGNMLLGVAVAILSIVGLGTNVYKHNTGENVEWFSIVSEPQHGRKCRVVLDSFGACDVRRSNVLYHLLLPQPQGGEKRQGVNLFKLSALYEQ